AMDKPEQVGSAHDNLSDLLHAIDPPTLIRIVAAAAGLSKVERIEIKYRNPRVQVAALVHPAGTNIVDCIYTVHDADGRTIEIWLLEVELSLDQAKPRKWSLYVVAFEYELGGDAQLVVFSPMPKLREKIRTQLVPRMRIEPIIIEPDQIERITDYEDARQRPELAILGCLYHCHASAPIENRVAVLRAAVVAVKAVASLDKIQGWRYAALVMQLVPSQVVKQGVEELREAGELGEDGEELVSESERYGHSYQLGREEGREEGRCEQLRQGIVDVLELRGLVLGERERERIAACESLERLERWYAAAKTAAANQPVDELLS
ncbi:MAG: hypothetical protein R6X02_23010, partial [Enhygromyxa sp.]